MRSTAVIILKALREHGELPIESIAKLLPLKHGDHRDFYVLASLVSRGLIDDPYLHGRDNDPDTKNNYKEQMLARKFFATCFADKAAAYGTQTWMIAGGNETLRGQNYALSGLGDLMLDEISAKRWDRIWSLASGITVGIVVAIVINYFGVK
ncbi:MAG TPA: hypothetical protein PLY04_18345 [bacterium]|nr:hypothetical protein [bacterium]